MDLRRDTTIESILEQLIATGATGLSRHTDKFQNLAAE